MTSAPLSRPWGMTRTHRGSCHCGAVQFTCELDLSEGTSRCNCSICRKTRFWKAIVRAERFRLLAGAESLTDYQFGRRSIHHLFCRACGVKTFGRGEHEALGGVFFAVNVACLDDVTPEELAAAPVRSEDGAHDAWERELDDPRHL